MTGTSGSIAPAVYPDQYNLLATGEETIPRSEATSSTAATSGLLRLNFFTARKSELTTQGRVSSGSTAAGATPTLCRFGLYLIAANGDGTLVASIANDTALFAAANTPYTRAWSTPYQKVAGQRYAAGSLVVTGATAPTLLGGVGLVDLAEAAMAPRVTGSIAAQTDLPLSFVAGSLTGSGGRLYMAILP